MAMATRIAVMDRGILQQVGTPEEVYMRPRNLFVAHFMGPLNPLTGKAGEISARGGKVEIGGRVMEVEWFAEGSKSGQRGVAAFRPSAVRLEEGPAGNGPGNMVIEAEVVQSQYTGASQRLSLKSMGFGGNEAWTFQAWEANPRRMRCVGEKVRAVIERRDWMFFPEEMP